MTVGVFDGVHRGHRALIERVLTFDPRALPVIITFRQNHKKRNPAYPGDINSFRQKIALFESLGISLVVAADLNVSFRHMGGAEFLGLLRERGNMRFLAVGSNFRCGYHLDTDASGIKDMNAREWIPTDIVETLTEDGEVISSSRIRKAIFQGKLGEAQAMLSRPHILDLGDGAGQVLPPPGSYGVKFHERDGSSRAGKIEIEQGGIVDAPPTAEYIEFLA